MSTPALHYSALAYLADHQGEHLAHDKALLVNRCIEHMVDTFGISAREAEVTTLQALGEYESRNCKAYLDTSLTTSHTVFIRDLGTGRLRVFTVAELVALVKTPVLSSAPVPSTRAMLSNGVAEPA
ncbi:hypothetical protein [Paraburkholderia lycopersici]|uniref:Uncharacterized protein n=1 Tax=Paraburkholderia lycopersici TaxID=416944 RepID=A0A1G7CS58_9BURK|nr:hypothetical protein [Paraburkholderia lycopersici]SDE42139.1 hypothetical protein SAMN05421548_14741 [Paraburkholderia lycopersici]